MSFVSTLNLKPVSLWLEQLTRHLVTLLFEMGTTVEENWAFYFAAVVVTAVAVTAVAAAV